MSACFSCSWSALVQLEIFARCVRNNTMFVRYILLLCRDDIYQILKECLLRNKNMYQILKGIMFLYSCINFDRRSSLLMGLTSFLRWKTVKYNNQSLSPILSIISLSTGCTLHSSPEGRSRPMLCRASLTAPPIEGQYAACLPCLASVYSRGST